MREESVSRGPQSAAFARWGETAKRCGALRVLGETRSERRNARAKREGEALRSP